VGHLGGTNVRDNWIEQLDGTMDQEINNGQDNGTKQKNNWILIKTFTTTT